MHFLPGHARPLRFAFLAVIAVLAPMAARAQDAPGQRPAEAIQDNSFLIEEAYNQDAGVVQHILNIEHSVDRHAGEDERRLSFVFTQEWPLFSQTHQLSYSVPYTFLDDEEGSADGFEDLSLNYRLQLLSETARTPAVAPRLSLILPTGDAARGLGDDTLGYQINLPLSKIVSDRWTVHANVGATLLPDVDDHDLVSFNLGASAIYAVSRTFNLMLEATADWEEEVDESGGTSRPASIIISPGFRYAFNHPGDAQTVIGLAAPIGVSSAAPEFGVFVYASFEHFFSRPKKSATGK
ncbi:MAG TPA: transporter [Chthoniobacterales bacterium]